MKSNKHTSNFNIIGIINRNKRLLGVIIFLVYSSIVITPFINKSNEPLETSYYISQIVSGLFVIAGVAIALVQYIANNNEIRSDRKRQAIYEASNLADIYCDQIINKSSALSKLVAPNTKVKDYYEKVKKHELTDFDNEESIKIFEKDVFIDWLSSLAVEYAKQNNIDLDNNNGIDEVLSRIFSILVALANKLESICIKLNTGIADQLTVYQSLHSNLFDCVDMLYIYIAHSNINECDRLYYNLTETYLSWKKIYTEISKEEEKCKKELADKITKEKSKEAEKRKEKYTTKTTVNS